MVGVRASLVAEAAALEWVDQNAPGSLTFVERPTLMEDDTTRELPHEQIRVESQVDLLYDLTVPFERLLHAAQVSVVSGVSVRYASLEHLLELKKARRDQSAADAADIAFLRERLRG
jgi:predicted nucleotidyltransferase